MQVAITLEGDTIAVRGSGVDVYALEVMIRQRAANGDSRSSTHRARAADEQAVARSESRYTVGDVDFTEAVAFVDGEIGVWVGTGGEVVASEVFHRG